MGFMAYKAGLRFTVYAVPIYALGIGFVSVMASEYIKTVFQQNTQNIAKYFILAVITVFVLYPNIIHIINYKVPTVFNKEEVTVISKFSEIAKRNDYVVSWWDYGYPLRYYGKIKTLLDGGVHAGELNFPVSYAFMHNQISAANISRLYVEYTAQGTPRKFLVNTLLDREFKDPNDFLLAIDDKDFKLPVETRDIYFYLPVRMLDILPTVAIFGTIDLTTGKREIDPFFYQTSWFKEGNEKIDFGRGVFLDKKTSMLKIGSQMVPIQKFVTVGYKGNELAKHEQVLNPTSNISIIYMRNYNKMLIVDEFYYNSTYIQLFVFENYDKELFEPVMLSPLSKVYNLKR
jgi:dolichyl-diphosphooligosaccharide--protein glycosyltransferase/undecaprenyl-diphosphooligosaccharide--protein glycosyltransferase